MIFFCERQYLYVFKTVNKDNSYFFSNTRLSFDMGPVAPETVDLT